MRILARAINARGNAPASQMLFGGDAILTAEQAAAAVVTALGARANVGKHAQVSERAP
jgi:hypothetical protein